MIAWLVTRFCARCAAGRAISRTARHQQQLPAGVGPDRPGIVRRDQRHDAAEAYRDRGVEHGDDKPRHEQRDQQPGDLPHEMPIKRRSAAGSSLVGGAGSGFFSVGSSRRSKKRNIGAKCARPRPRSTRPRIYRSSGKSSSQNSAGLRSFAARRAASPWRSSTRRILPEIVFGNSANSIRRTRLKGDSRARRCRRSTARSRGPARGRRASATNAFGTARRIGSGEGTTAASATAAMLDQRALQLERADPVVGGFEHVVGAADIGEVARRRRAARCRRCGSTAPSHRRDARPRRLIALHQAERRRIKRQADLALVLLAARRHRAARRDSPAAAGPSSPA